MEVKNIFKTDFEKRKEWLLQDLSLVFSKMIELVGLKSIQDAFETSMYLYLDQHHIKGNKE